MTCLRQYNIKGSQKRVVEWRRLSGFLAKMTLVNACAVIEYWENLVLEVVLILES